jgi:chromosome partitioning protein
MRTIAIIAQKGGAGKTTLAINLACAAQANDQAAAVVDLDPQQSAQSWFDHRGEDTPTVVSAQPKRLEAVLEAAAKDDIALTILDTAPAAETSALEAARRADLVLIPCRPGVLDLRAIATTIDTARLAHTPAVGLINTTPAQGSLGHEAAEAIAGYGLEVTPVRIGHRAAFMHALTASQSVLEWEPKSKAASEVLALYEWLCQHDSMTTHKHDSKVSA